MIANIKDGLINVLNHLANNRAATRANVIYATRVPMATLREMSKTGVCSKIVRIKVAGALKDTLQFETPEAEAIYTKRIESVVMDAARSMLCFGRGVILIADNTGEPHKPRTGAVDLDRVRLVAFSGDEVFGQMPDTDLMSERYMKPQLYQINGISFHHSRIIDFTYVKPTTIDAPHYSYGGISELELIHDQVVNDQVVERASGTIIDKNSTFFHKIKGFKEALAAKQDRELIQYMTELANNRSIFGDGVMDAEDDVVAVTQSLTDLAEVSRITLQRLAMVCGIPVPMLVGQSVEGLNSAGDQERNSLNDTFQELQGYLLGPINELLAILGLPPVKWAAAKEGTAEQQIAREQAILTNAKHLFDMGEDYGAYLVEKGIIKPEESDLMTEYAHVFALPPAPEMDHGQE
jgi:hypothetical protein